MSILSIYNTSHTIKTNNSLILRFTQHCIFTLRKWSELKQFKPFHHSTLNHNYPNSCLQYRQYIFLNNSHFMNIIYLRISSVQLKCVEKQFTANTKIDVHIIELWYNKCVLPFENILRSKNTCYILWQPIVVLYDR